jgi:hypothetical protein
MQELGLFFCLDKLFYDINVLVHKLDLTDVRQVPYGVGKIIAIHFCPKFSFVMGVSFETFIFLCAKVNFLRVFLFYNLFLKPK